VGSNEDTQPDFEKIMEKHIWSLEVPNKYKNLVWQASRNSLLTKLNLTQKTIIENPTCDRCSSTIEDLLHAFWGWVRYGMEIGGAFSQGRCLQTSRNYAGG